MIAPRPESVFPDPNTHKSVHWEAAHTFNPAAVVRGGRVWMLYRAEDDSGKAAIGGHTSRLGLASSADGIHFDREPAPVFYPEPGAQHGREWPGGVEDPRLVEREDGLYLLTYTQWNRKTFSVGIAASPDLRRWTRQGPAFGANGTLGRLRYKSAGIVTELRNDRLLAAKIHGKYWMYWGEGAVHLATSPDAIHWTPVQARDGSFVEFLKPRPGRFDSSFPETGPPPVLTPSGIVVLYNGKNAGAGGDAALGPGAYSAGEALFSAESPGKLLAQTDAPVLRPREPYEKTGQYAAGTTFAEGLVLFQGRWLLYYGCADSLVAVAAAPTKP